MGLIVWAVDSGVEVGECEAMTWFNGSPVEGLCPWDGWEWGGGGVIKESGDGVGG